MSAEHPIVEMKPIAWLKPYANNPRDNRASIDKVAASIEAFGFLVPIVALPDGEVLAGHTRLKAAQRLRLKEVPVLVADSLDDAKARAFRLADNKAGEESKWDLRRLDEELALCADIDMAAFGFEPEDDPKEGETDCDDAPLVVDEPPKSVAGSLYKLGEHRLLCGDATQADDVREAMAGGTAALWLTDPPYNVAYESADGKTIQNDSMDDSAFRDFLAKAFTAAAHSLEPGAPFYIFHADSEGFNFRAACRDAGLKVRQCLIWKKNAMVMGRQDYQWQHEPCLFGEAHSPALYGWKDGAAHHWYGDRKQTTILEFAKPAKSADHPTMKPVVMLEHLLKLSSKRGDVVLDTFGGSGSTLIACERLGRKCHMVELDPRYCDVIRRRWAEHVHGAGCDWEALTPEEAQRG